MKNYFLLIFSIIFVINKLSSQIQFNEKNITKNADGLFCIVAGDMDNDGDLDIVSASYRDDKIAWYENDGKNNPNFLKHTITVIEEGAISVEIGDIDNDGDLDIVSASYDDNNISWYENDGNINPTFSSHVVSTNVNGAVSVDLGDIDSDGDLDIVSASYLNNSIQWHENDGKSFPNFKTIEITNNFNEVRSVNIGDYNNDGSLDIASASVKEDEIAILFNGGDADLRFTKNIVSTQADGAYYIYSSDINMDGNKDLVSASIYDDKIAWYENDGEISPSFKTHVVSLNADAARSVHSADLDNDGDVDIISASYYDDKIAWYENDGEISPSFKTHVVSLNADAARSVHSADLDNDGDVDIISASYNDDKIAWYQNNLTTPIISVQNDTMKVLEDSSASINFLSNDIIQRIDNYSISIIDSSKNGNTTLVRDSLISFEPKKDFFGIDSIKYSIFNDDISDSGTILINVLNINDKPGNFSWLISQSDSLFIDQSNANKFYNFSWTESIDPDGDEIEYLIYSMIGNTNWNLWTIENSNSATFLYSELLDYAFKDFPNNEALTLKLLISATDQKDTIQIDNGDRSLFINRYQYLSLGEKEITNNFELYKNYPNPFNPQTKIIFGIPHEADIRILIYDILGRKIKEINYENLNAGKHSIIWNTKDDFANNVAPGVYFCQLNSNTGYTETIKMILLK